MTADRLLFLGSYEDQKYLALLRGCVGGASVAVVIPSKPLGTVTEFKMLCKQKQITKVISTNVSLLTLLLAWKARAKPALSSYAGSFFNVGEIQVIFIPPIKQLATVTYGKFLTTRFIQKFTREDKWFKPTKFEWELFEPKNAEFCYQMLSQCFLIAVDVETRKEPLAITHCGYTGYYMEDGTMKSFSTVMQLDSMFKVTWMRKLNDLDIPKVMQNGNYDNAYFFLFNAPLRRYTLDTANLFHCYYSELPKDLGFLNAFFLREAMFWKDLSGTSDELEYCKYCALDTWATGNTAMAMLLEMPDWAMANYYQEFPNIFGCHMADMRGIKRDQERLLEARAEQDELIAKYQKSVRKMLGKPDFNTNSPKQVKQLLGVLGCSDIKSTQEKDLEKARFRHPLNARILELVINNRKARKLASTYLTVGDDAKEYKGRILFAFKPHGTDTGRLASSEHHFWCGIQGQNIPRGPIVKQTFVADPGFVLFEVDLEQAESRDTAYISGEPKLIDAVSGDNDFHSQNCANFFGVPYEKIYDNTERKTLDKELRDLAKRVNHGTNYGMGWYMLVDTMGLENIFKAKGLLQLSKFWGAKQVSVHLLDSYHKAYPGIANVYYKKMLMEVKTDNMLVSKAQHMIDDIPYWGGWTRYCFGDPDKSKHARNSYIAHVPQSLNAQTLNRGWVRVYRDIAMNPEYCDYIKLIAQVHDSIFGQVRIGHEHLVQRVADLMQIPVKIKSYDGNEYLFTVPADAGETAKYWSEL